MKRDLSNKVLFGVCSGLAKQFGLSVAGVRAGFCLAFLFGSASFWVYLILLFIMSIDEEQ